MRWIIRCQYPMPAPELQNRVFETTSLSDHREGEGTFTITPDGRLVQDAGDIEDLYVDAMPQTFHGEIRFTCGFHYEVHGDRRWRSRTFSALFADGKLISLTERTAR